MRFYLLERGFGGSHCAPLSENESRSRIYPFSSSLTENRIETEIINTGFRLLAIFLEIYNEEVDIFRNVVTYSFHLKLSSVPPTRLFEVNFQFK